MDKKTKKIIFIAIFLPAYSAAWIYFSPQLVQTFSSYGRLDSDSQHMIATVVVAGSGLSLFGLRIATQKSMAKKDPMPKDVRKRYLLAQIEAFDLLILTVVPGAEAFAFILKTYHNYPAAFVPYIFASSGWFILIAILHEKFEDPRQEKNFWVYQSLWAIMLFVFGILALWMLNTYSQIMQQASQHITPGS